MKSFFPNILFVFQFTFTFFVCFFVFVFLNSSLVQLNNWETPEWQKVYLFKKVSHNASQKISDK